MVGKHCISAALADSGYLWHHPGWLRASGEVDQVAPTVKGPVGRASCLRGYRAANRPRAWTSGSAGRERSRGKSHACEIGQGLMAFMPDGDAVHSYPGTKTQQCTVLFQSLFQRSGHCYGANIAAVHDREHVGTYIFRREYRAIASCKMITFDTFP